MYQNNKTYFSGNVNAEKKKKNVNYSSFSWFLIPYQMKEKRNINASFMLNKKKMYQKQQTTIRG